MKNVRCYWRQNGKLCQANVDNNVTSPFQSYEDLLSFVKSNLTIADKESRKFAVLAVVE